MALVFDIRNIEVKFFSNAVINDGYKKELIIYPVLAHKVYAPVVDDLNLNIFQKYVLSILNKGNYSFENIAEWLNLDLLLVKTIAAELSNKGLLNINTLEISSKGKELIEGSFSWFNNSENIKKDIRYIFQDIFTHKIYPVVLPFDNFQENVWLGKGQLNIGTKGKKDSYNYDLISPENINLRKIRKPDANEIIEAIDKHMKIYVPDSKNDLKEAPNAISFLDEEPDLLYCATWIYSDNKNKSIENIEVADPFNIYDQAYWLKESIIKAEKQNNDAFSEVLHKLVYSIEEDQKNKASEFMDLFDRELEKELTQTFDFSLKKDNNDLYKALYEFYYEIKFYNIHKSTIHLKNAFGKSQTVLETLFKIIQLRYKDDYKEIYDIATYNTSKVIVLRDEIKEKIKKINNNSEFPEEKYPSYWRHKFFNDVGGVLKNPDNGSLRSMFVAGILASFLNNENPIYTLIQNKNNLPVRIEWIAQNRNEHGHKYSEIPLEEIENYYNDAISMYEDVKEIIQIFLNS